MNDSGLSRDINQQVSSRSRTLPNKRKPQVAMSRVLLSSSPIRSPKRSGVTLLTRLEAAKDLASTAQDRLQHKVAEQKDLGAEMMEQFCRRQARLPINFDFDVPVAGTYMRKAADQIEIAADALKKGNFSDLVQGAQRFARSQPTAFFGLALLAGFGAVRF